MERKTSIDGMAITVPSSAIRLEILRLSMNLYKRRGRSRSVAGGDRGRHVCREGRFRLPLSPGTGLYFRDTLLVLGNKVEQNIVDWIGTGSRNFTIQTSGSSISGVETCSEAYDDDTFGWQFSSYIATPDVLTLYSAQYNYSMVYDPMQ